MSAKIGEINKALKGKLVKIKFCKCADGSTNIEGQVAKVVEFANQNWIEIMSSEGIVFFIPFDNIAYFEMILNKKSLQKSSSQKETSYIPRQEPVHNNDSFVYDPEYFKNANVQENLEKIKREALKNSNRMPQKES